MRTLRALTFFGWILWLTTPALAVDKDCWCTDKTLAGGSVLATVARCDTLTAKGSIGTASTGGTCTEEAVGADGTIPVADSADGNGWSWRNPLWTVTLGPWHINDLAGTATTQAKLAFFTAAGTVNDSTTTAIEIKSAAHVIGMFLLTDNARSGGTATATVWLNGASTAFSAGAVELNATETLSDSAMVAPSSGVAVAAGDTVGCSVVTSSWTPTTADVNCFIVLSFD